MNPAWSFLVTFWQYLPWVAVAMMAGLALRKRRESRALLVQTVGAGALFVLAMAKWVIVDLLLRWLNAQGMITAGEYIFGFLLFVSLCTFAGGYCAERFARRKPEQAP